MLGFLNESSCFIRYYFPWLNSFDYRLESLPSSCRIPIIMFLDFSPPKVLLGLKFPSKVYIYPDSSLLRKCKGSYFFSRKLVWGKGGRESTNICNSLKLMISLLSRALNRPHSPSEPSNLRICGTKAF